MNKKIDDISFDDIDISKYQKEIDKIDKIVKAPIFIFYHILHN